ncbi:MAG: hypothetical protein ACQESX_04465 [Bacteroidota bacterium]
MRKSEIIIELFRKPAKPPALWPEAFGKELAFVSARSMTLMLYSVSCNSTLSYSMDAIASIVWLSSVIHEVISPDADACILKKKLQYSSPMIKRTRKLPDNSSSMKVP